MQATIRNPSELPTPKVSGAAPETRPLFDGPPLLESTYAGGARRGRVTVSMAPIPDAGAAGWDAVFGADGTRGTSDSLESRAGFPALLARVEPEGHGYQNCLGWIQFVNERHPKGASVSSEHDPIWFLRGKEVPYGAVGYAPTFFDAPTRPARRAVLWEADLFLCTVPSVSPVDRRPDSPLEPLAGVRWGFRIPADGEAPQPIAPRWTGDWAWASWVPVLRKAFPTWRFADRTTSVALGSPL
jgi:hypothetical protein